MPLEQWRDTMVKALTLGLPASLDDLGGVLGLGADQAKIKEGGKLIHRFCAPAPANHKATRYTRETHPEEWARFVEYARRDVEAMRTIDRMLPDWNYKGSELALWHLDQKINDRGLPVDLELVDAVLEMLPVARRELNKELRQVTGGLVPAASNVGALAAWVRSRGVNVTSLTSADVAEWLADVLPDDVRRALEIRAEAGKSSTAKYTKLKEATAADGRIRGTLQFCGASRTGRWGGRLFQPQNLPRPSVDVDTGCNAILNGTVDLLYDSPIEVASSSIRGAIKAPAGRVLVVSDLAGIEGRVLPWLCRFQGKLDQIAGGMDMYKVAASGIYGVQYAAVTKDQRFVGKVAELALGYQGGVNALQGMARNYGVNLDEDLASQTVSGWREANAPIKRFWWTMQDAMLQAFDTPNTPFVAGRLQVVYNQKRKMLIVRLPSGRGMVYYKPMVYERQMPWGEYGRVLAYWGVNQTTRKVEMIETYGGRAVENATQAVARDVLAAAMPRIEDAGFEIVGTVHDEVITLADEGSALDHHRLSELLATPPDWADGLPLAAEGYTSMRYQK